MGEGTLVTIDFEVFFFPQVRRWYVWEVAVILMVTKVIIIMRSCMVCTVHPVLLG
jgi:hypothetical protein